MSRVRSIMMGALVVCALLAVTATAAMAAAPEFLTAAKVAPAKGTAFTGTSGTTKLFSKANKTVITCTADEAVGATFQSATTVEGSLKYTGCTGDNKKAETKCEVKSKGAGKEEIKTNLLKGKLGYISKAAKEDGVELKPIEGAFTTLEGTCLPTTPAAVEGGVVCKAEPVNVLQTTGKLFCGQTKEEQNIKKLEGGAETFLKVFGLAAAIEGTENVTFKEAIETTA